MKRPEFIVYLMVAALVGLLVAPALAGAHPRDDGLPPGGDDGVWVIGGWYSNTYHPNYCQRVKAHKNDARWVPRKWAVSRGLRRHRYCAPSRRRGR